MSANWGWRRLGAALGLGLWLVGTAPAGARDLTVGVEPMDFSPIYGWHNGEFRGAAREILDAFAAARGHHLTYRAYPIRRLLAELTHGGIDLKFPDNPDWQAAMRRGTPLTYSAPVIAYVDGTLVRRERVGEGEAAVRSLGIIAGFTPQAWQGRIAAGTVDLTENPGFEPLLRQVAAGRVDGAYLNVAAGLAAAAAVVPAGTLAYDPALPHVAESYRLSSGTAPEVIAEFDQWLKENHLLVMAIIARTGAEAGLTAGH